MLEKSKKRQLAGFKKSKHFVKDEQAPSNVSRSSLNKLKELSLKQGQKIRHLMQQIEAKDSQFNKMQQLISAESKAGLITDKFRRNEDHLRSPTDDFRVYWYNNRDSESNINVDLPLRRPKMASFDSEQLPNIQLNQCTDRKTQGNQLLRLPLAVLQQVTPDELARRMRQKVVGGWSADPERNQ